MAIRIMASNMMRHTSKKRALASMSTSTSFYDFKATDLSGQEKQIGDLCEGKPVRRVFSFVSFKITHIYDLRIYIHIHKYLIKSLNQTDNRSKRRNSVRYDEKRFCCNEQTRRDVR